MPEGTPPRYSDDGKWWWDGQQWVPVSSPPPSRRPHVWLAIAGAMLILVVAGGLVYGVIAAAGILRAGSTQLAPNTGPAFLMLRMCSADNFDSQRRICTKNQAARPFETDRLICSAEFNGNIGQQLTSSILYQGHEVLRFSRMLKDPKSTDYLAYAIAQGKPLPGGDWSCQFSLDGHSQSTHTQLNGPTGVLLYSSACNARAIVSESGPRICNQDEATIARPIAIGCTAVARGVENKEVEVHLVYSGGQAQPFTRTAKGIANSRLFSASFALQAQDAGIIGQMPAGGYTCRWLVDGNEVGQKNFQVSA